MLLVPLGLAQVASCECYHQDLRDDIDQDSRGLLEVAT